LLYFEHGCDHDFLKIYFVEKKKALGQRKTFTLDDFGFGYQAYLHFIFTV
jgi:hypothetical protein